MRMSCNGCRVLRKGCVENCTLRPCLEWIESPESQANATLFLAKFYGRAGLINLIKSGPNHLRLEIFRSLLYEACGRIISPVHGSVGLMCSGDWPRCQAAVEAVLRGEPLAASDEDDSAAGSVVPLQSCGIGHLSKDVAAVAGRRGRFRNQSKRSAADAESRADSFAAELMSEMKFTITGWDEDRKGFELKRARSYDSYSVETVEPALVNRSGRPSHGVAPEPEEIGLQLTLGGPNLVIGAVIEISDS